MNGAYLFEKMTDIDDTYICSAWERLSRSASAKQNIVRHPRTGRSFRRCIALAAAVLLMLTASLATAMAASEEFREMVFAFLGIEETVVVPRSDAGGEISPDNLQVDPERTAIGAVMEGVYIHTPKACLANSGVFLLCTDESMMNSGNHFDAYAERDGQLVKLEEHRFSHDYTILGNDVHMDFMWVEHNGMPVITYIEPETPYRMLNMSGTAKASLVLVSCRVTDSTGAEHYTGYPVLLDLETGVLTDALAGSGAEELPNISNAAISEDLSKMLLISSEGTIYYADLLSKTLFNVSELSGESVGACSLIENTLACWALDNASYETAELGSYRAWAIDLTTMERTELFTGIPATAATSHDVWSETYDLARQAPGIWAEIGCGDLPPLGRAGLHFIDGFDNAIHGGNMYAGSRFAVELDGNGSVYVIDLTDGVKTVIEGFLWPDAEYPAIECIPSPDGEKLLISVHQGLVYEQIGVLDFGRRTYTQFSRDNLNDVSEYTIYWFDNDSVAVCADSAAFSYDFYIYSLSD